MSLKLKVGARVLILAGAAKGAQGIIETVYANAYQVRAGDGRPWIHAEGDLAPVQESDSAARKGQPLFSGCLMYFPDALLAVSEHSRKGNDKHNPGKPLHWSKDKSTDHADCIARHLTDIGPTWDSKDPEFDSLHATALAWRALALLQTVLERKKGSQ